MFYSQPGSRKGNRVGNNQKTIDMKKLNDYGLQIYSRLVSTRVPFSFTVSLYQETAPSAIQRICKRFAPAGEP